MAIDRIKVRAKIVIGNLIVQTGEGHADVMSFNVTKSRRTSSTFSASLKVPAGAITGNLTGSNVRIMATGEVSSGEVLIDEDSDTIFNGVVRSVKINPCFDDPYYVILAISGSDVLSFLRGKKYTRRCRATKSSWVAINSVNRKKLKSGKFEVRKEEMFDITDGELPTDSGHVKHRVPTYEKINTASPKLSDRTGVVNLNATYHEG